MVVCRPMCREATQRLEAKKIQGCRLRTRLKTRSQMPRRAPLPGQDTCRAWNPMIGESHVRAEHHQESESSEFTMPATTGLNTSLNLMR